MRCSYRAPLDRVLPGPYFDVETGKHPNYFRDYDPAIGRYLESDLTCPPDLVRIQSEICGLI